MLICIIKIVFKQNQFFQTFFHISYSSSRSKRNYCKVTLSIGMHRTSGQISRHEKYPESRIFNRLPVFTYKLWPDTIYCRKTLMCGCLLWKTEHFQEESLYNMYVPVPLDIWYPVFGVAEYSISSASPNPGLPSLIRKASHNVDPCGSRIANTGEEKSVWTKSYRIPEITKAGSSRLAGFSVHFSIQCFRSIFI